MATEVTLETAERDLRGVLDRLRPGERVRLVDAQGKPVAVLTSLKGSRRSAAEVEAWLARWRAMAHDIGEAWKTDLNAVEAVTGQRR